MVSELTSLLICLTDPIVVGLFLCAFSTLITGIHTFDEILGEGGPIWDYIGVSEVCYFTFQTILVIIAGFGYSCSNLFLLILLILRLVDFGFTHNILRLLKQPRSNPGFITSWLLLVDAIIIGMYLWNL